MKTLFLFLMLQSSALMVAAQPVNFSSVQLKTTDGVTVDASQALNTGGFTLMVFWKSGNAKCCDNIQTLQNAWASSLKDKGVKLVAICVDCAGNWTHVKPFVSAHNWEFQVFVDVNGDFKRFMNVNTVPSTLIINENSEVICRQIGFCAGDDSMICEMIEAKISKK
jgi:hypothetical protein